MTKSIGLDSSGFSSRNDIEEAIVPILPNRALEDRIEIAIANLRSGDTCIIAEGGEIFNDRTVFLRSGQKPLISFDKRTDGNEFSVYNGLPSNNGTYTTRGGPRIDTNVILGSHDSFIISDVRIVIPEARSASSQPESIPTGIEKITRDLALLSEGESMTIGRLTHHGLPSSVSRFHAVVTRQNDIAGRPSYILTDGIAGGAAVSIQASDDAPTIPLYGRKSLAPGAKVFIAGSNAPITLPETAPAPGEIGIEQSYRTGMKIGFSEMIKGREIPLQSVSSGSLFGRSMAAMAYPDMLVSPLEASMIGIHVREGLRLVKEEKFNEAYKHFSDPSVLEAAGYSLRENHFFTLREISGEEIVRVLHRVAGDSWFKPGSKLVYPSGADLRPGLEPQSDHEVQLLKDFRRELCLITAEEWIHGFQNALNSNVSRKGALIEGLPDAHEIDVAQFMAEQKIPLSYEFLNNRYPDRAIVLEKLKGFQTPEEVNGVSEKISLLRIGQSLRIGTNEVREGIESNAQYQYWQIGAQAEGGSSIRENPEYSTLAARHAQITKLSNGYFSLFSNSPGNVYSQDTNRIWHPVENSIILEPGTKFRLGRFFQLQIPDVNIGENFFLAPN